MKIRDVIEKYNQSKNKAYEIARIMGIEIKGREYIFPSDFVPVYIPDGRNYRAIKKMR